MGHGRRPGPGRPRIQGHPHLFHLPAPERPTVPPCRAAPPYHQRVNNLTLARRCADHHAQLGIELEPLNPADPTASSDIGNVSRVLPAIHPYLQIVDRGTPVHPEAFRDAAATAQTHDRAALMAAALARTALDTLTDSGFLTTFQQEFERATAELTPALP